MSEATASLIAAAREGDLNAFRQLHAHYIGRTHALCLRLLADRQRAEDACQETFIKVWQQLPEFVRRAVSVPGCIALPPVPPSIFGDATRDCD